MAAYGADRVRERGVLPTGVDGGASDGLVRQAHYNASCEIRSAERILKRYVSLSSAPYGAHDWDSLPRCIVECAYVSGTYEIRASLP